METNRLEALSDGVFAVAITLLVLELKVPAVSVTEAHGHHGLGAALREEWPTYLAYVLSFLFVLITWINHHALFRVVRKADHAFLLMNGLLLMAITVIPFTTELLATYLREEDRKTAVIVYNCVFLVMASTFNRMWAYASRNGRLLAEDADPQYVQDITRQYAVGPPIYTLVFVLGFWNAWVSLILSIALAVFFALPNSITRRGDKSVADAEPPSDSE